MSKRSAALVLWCLPVLAAATTWPQPAYGQPTVGAYHVTVSGPGWRLHPRVVSRAVDLRIGDAYDPAIMRADVERLRKYPIFSGVKARFAAAPGGVTGTVDLRLRTRWSLIPEIEGEQAGGSGFLLLGVRDANFLGRNQVLTATAGVFRGETARGAIGWGNWIDRQFLGRHSLRVEFSSLFFDDRLYTRRARIQTASERRNTMLLLEPAFRLSDRWHLEWQAAYTHERIRANARYATATVAPILAATVTDRTRSKGTLAVRLLYDRLRDFRFVQQGFWAALKPEYGIREAETTQVLRLTAESVQVYRPWYRLGIALRQLAIVQNDVATVDEVLIGGSFGVRGYPSGFLRANRVLIANIEVRPILVEAAWDSLFIGAVGFIDSAVAARLPTTNAERDIQAAGGGLRFGIHQLMGSFIRVDAATPIFSPVDNVDVSVAIEHFF